MACLFLCLLSVFSGLISAFEASLFLVFSFFGTAEKDLKYVEESFYCFIFKKKTSKTFSILIRINIFFISYKKEWEPIDFIWDWYPEYLFRFNLLTCDDFFIIILLILSYAIFRSTDFLLLFTIYVNMIFIFSLLWILLLIIRLADCILVISTLYCYSLIIFIV